MGLLRGFVFNPDLRGILAACAVAAAVAYTLLGAAATTGLTESENTRSTDSEGPYVVASRAGLSPIPLAEIPGSPLAALSVADVGDETLYAVRIGSALTNQTNVTVGLASALQPGEIVHLDGENFTVEARANRIGAANDWIEVTPAVLDRLAPETRDQVHVVVYRQGEATPDLLASAGLSAVTAPAAPTFFREGAQQLVGALILSLAGSAIVVGILSGSYVALELHARRRELATLQLFGGPKLVTRILLARTAVLTLAGIIGGLAITYVVVRLLRRSGFGAASFPIEFALWGILVFILGASLGVLPALLTVRRRLSAHALRVQAPKTHSSFLRPVLTSKRAIIAWTLACAILSGGMGVLFGIVDAPRDLLEDPDSEVVTSTQGNPLHGRVSAFVGLNLHELEHVTTASPEIYCPTMIQGEPAMVRGVEWNQFAQFEKMSTADPPAPGQVVLGSRLADRLDAKEGDVFPVPSCYAAAVSWLTVQRIAVLPGELDDEALVDLSTARSLSDTRHIDVNLVRFRVTDSDNETAATVPSGIEAVSLRVEPENPVPLQPSAALLRVINFDSVARTRQFTLIVNNEVTADTFVTMPAESIREVSIPFDAPLTTPIRLRVNPTTETEAGRSAYAITAPDPMLLGVATNVRISAADGSPAANVKVTLDGNVQNTDASGTASITAPIAGTRSLRAEGPDGFGARLVRVVDARYENESHLEIRRLDGPTTASRVGWQGVAYVENIGGQTFDGTLFIAVDGQPVNTTQLRVPSGEQRRAAIQLNLTEGQHVIGNASHALNVTILGDAAVDPDEVPVDAITDVQQLLEIRRQRARPASTAQEEPLSRFLADAFQNFDAALTLVVLVTIAQAAFAFLFSVRRELEERAPNLAILLALGATVGQIRMQMIREYGAFGLIAATLGTTIGLALASLAARLGFLLGFGHALSPRLEPLFFVQLIIVCAGCIVGAALIQGDPLLRRSIRDLRSTGPSRARRPALSILLEPPQ